MELITDLLQRIVALLTSIVMSVTPMTDTMEVLFDDYLIMPLASYSSFYIFSGSTSMPNTGYSCAYYGGGVPYNASARTLSPVITVGIPVILEKGNSVSVTWSGFNTYLYRETKTNGNILSSSFSNFWSASRSFTSYVTPSCSLVSDASTLVPSVSMSSGSYSFDVSETSNYIALRFAFPQVTVSANQYYYAWVECANAQIAVTVNNTYEQFVITSLSDIALSNRAILQAVQDLNSTVGTPSAMEQFENNYLDKMEDQLSRVDDMLGPENTALPNGGDFAGFVSDIQDGLGVSGSSFSASEFAAATSAFGGSEATAPGGPWEFFSQAVADSLSGDTQSVGLNDDDYIYQWLDMIQGRYGLWSSSSP